MVCRLIRLLACPPLAGMVLLPFLVWGAPAQAKSTAGHRTQVFVVGLAEDLSHTAGELTQDLRKILQQTQGLDVLDLASRLQAPPPEKIKDLVEKARKELVAAKASLKEMEYPAMVEHATAARDAFEKMGGYLDPFERYQESILLQGVGESMQGAADKAKASFLDLLLLDPNLTLPRTSYESFVIDAFNEVKGTLSGLARGTLSIKTVPPGGNLYVDGKLKGVTPDSLDGIASGPHLVVVKMPGYQNYGRIVKVEAGNLVSLDVKLEAGKGGGGFNRAIEAAGKAIGDDGLRGEVIRLGQTIGLDWVWLCQLKHDGSNIAMPCYLFDFSGAKVVYDQKLEIEGEYGMQEEVHRFGEDFLAKGLKALAKHREQGDPLANRSGTEDWNEDSGDEAPNSNATTAKKKKPSAEQAGDQAEEGKGAAKAGNSKKRGAADEEEAAKPAGKKKSDKEDWESDDQKAADAKSKSNDGYDPDEDDASKNRQTKGKIEKQRPKKKESGDPLEDIDGTEDW